MHCQTKGNNRWETEGSLFLARSMAVMGTGLDDIDPYAFLLRITFRAFSCLLGKDPSVPGLPGPLINHLYVIVRNKLSTDPASAASLVSGSSFVNEGLNSSFHVVLGLKQDANSNVVSWPRVDSPQFTSWNSHFLDDWWLLNLQFSRS